MITRSIKAEVEPTPEELADCFLEMCHYDQARFFNALATQSKYWSKPFAVQMEAISDAGLVQGARKIMETIGDYAHHNQQIHATTNSGGA